MEFCKSQFIVVYMKNKVFVYKLLSLMFKSLNSLSHELGTVYKDMYKRGVWNFAGIIFVINSMDCLLDTTLKPIPVW